MNISDAGLAMICEFEGYHTALPDGGCTAYLCPAGVVTIGFGCTEGVKMGDVWSREQAEEALRRELATHEAAVNRLVTVDITRGQRDALISFSYNLGVGTLQNSTLLKKLNAGDPAGACDEFAKFNKAKVLNKKTGKREIAPVRGLTIRRAKEAAMFASRDDDEAAPMMPQKCEVPKEPMTPLQLATVVGGGATAVNQAVPMLPAASKAGESAVDLMAGAKQIGGALQEFIAWAAANPKFAVPGFLLVVLPLLMQLPAVQAYLPKKP